MNSPNSDNIWRENEGTNEIRRGRDEEPSFGKDKVSLTLKYCQENQTFGSKNNITTFKISFPNRKMGY